MEKVLEIINLKKSFDTKEVLKDISLYLNSGEIYFLLGPNGAGKTTTINILLGLLRKTSGTIKILGKEIKDAYPKEVKNKFGYIPDEPILMYWLTAFENMQFLAKLYNIKVSLSDIDKYLLDFNLFESRNELVYKFSKGMKQKLMFAMQIMHNPEIIIMDEPTNGLDPISMNQLKKLLLKYKTEGRCILISSHDIAFCEELSDRIGIIMDGEIKLNATKEQLVNKYNSDNLEEVIVKIIDKNN